MKTIKIPVTDKRIFLASDFHLGAPNMKASREREKKIIRWLHNIAEEAEAIFLVGDIFDFWFEYRKSIPKGFARFQGEIAALTDRGIKVYFFTGNHDLWMKRYFDEELGVTTYHEPVIVETKNHKLMVGHGDGLGPGDHFYKFLKMIFTNRFLQWAFGWVHPNIGIGIAHLWSRRSRISSQKKGESFKGNDEWLWQYCKSIEQHTHHDYYIFGHRHLPLELTVGSHSKYINLGEWINYSTYCEYDGEKAQLKTFE